jgi:hypothetical protein
MPREWGSDRRIEQVAGVLSIFGGVFGVFGGVVIFLVGVVSL